MLNERPHASRARGASHHGSSHAGMTAPAQETEVCRTPLTVFLPYRPTALVSAVSSIRQSLPQQECSYPPNRCGRPIRWLRASANRVCHLRCFCRFSVRLRRSGVKNKKARKDRVIAIIKWLCSIFPRLINPWCVIKPAASRFRRSWYRRVLIHASFLPAVSEIFRKDRC